MKPHSHQPQKQHYSNSHIALLVVGVFLCTYSVLPGAILIALGAYKLFFKKNKSESSKLSGDLQNVIFCEARDRGIEIPRDRDLWIMLQKLYRRHQTSIRSFPDLKEEFDSIMTAVWQHLAMNEDILHWKITIKEALEDWPVDSIKTSQQVKDALTNAREAAKTWKESRREAWEGKF